MTVSTVTSTDGGGSSSVNNNGSNTGNGNGNGNNNGNNNNNNNSNNGNNNNGTNNTGRRVLMAKTDSLSNVNNNNNNNNSSSVNNNNVTVKASVMSVRRVLFGPPAHPAETRAWLDRQLCAATAADSRSWNFDFVNERPLRDSPADRYAWERVCPPKRRDDVADPTATAATAQQPQPQPQQQRGGGGGGECRRTAGKQQRQSKVTDFMTKSKKRPLSVDAVGCTLRSNKVLDEPVSATKRSRRSVSTTMMAI